MSTTWDLPDCCHENFIDRLGIAGAAFGCDVKKGEQ
jgi:hypothetical protein